MNQDDINRRPEHPGQMLREDFLPDFNLSATALAEAIGVSRQSVYELLRERRSVSPEMAIRLGRLFGNSPEFWMNAQRGVDLWNAAEALKKDLERIKPLGAVQHGVEAQRRPTDGPPVARSSGHSMTYTSYIEISEAVQEAVSAIGPSAERWLADVHAQMATVSEAWDLILTGQLAHDGMCSIIMTAITSDGSDAILKLSVPHDDARGEAEALRHWNRNGAVGLIRSTPDGFTLLLERCQPGKNLWSVSLEEQIGVVSDLLPRLWLPAREGIGVRELSNTVSNWEMEMSHDPASFDVPVEIVNRAARWASDLRGSQDPVLLHGDLNPGNVLSDKGGTWIAIDPKPWVGDPAFDLAQLLVNWITLYDHSLDETASVIADAADQLATRLNLSSERILHWAVVKALAWRAGSRSIKVLDAAARMRSP